MSTYPKTLESRTRIHYQDCDPFHHLNNSRYIDYIVAARTEQLLEQYGFNTAELSQTQGIGWVAAQTHMSHFSPASWMERVTIESRLFQYTESSLWIEGLMWDEHQTRLKALLWTKLVHFHIPTQKSHRHSEELMQLFQAIHHPLEQFVSFDERVQALKQASKKS